MRLEIVDTAVHEAGRIEDPVAAMHDVVVEGDHHERRISDDASELARVERGVLHWLSRAQRLKAGQYVAGTEPLKSEV